MKKIAVFCAARNAVRYVQACVKSIAFQKYRHFRVFWLDDHSDDGTGELAVKLLKQYNLKYEYIGASERVGKTDLYMRALPACADDEIIFELDGDDWLVNPDAFRIVADEYQKGAWAVWGRDQTHWINKEKWALGRCNPVEGPVPGEPDVPSIFRSSPYFPEHPRTAYAGLLRLVNQDDLMFEGKYSDACTDRYMFCPIFEMSKGHVACTNQRIYWYNFPIPTNLCCVNPKRQPQTQVKLIASRAYDPLVALPFGVRP